jgi:hypothetical protein
MRHWLIEAIAHIVSLQIWLQITVTFNWLGRRADDAGGCPAFLLNIEKRSLPRLMLSGEGLASKDTV